MKTELKPYVNVDVDLSEKDILHLKEMANHLNMTIDQLIEKILQDAVAEEIEVEEFKKLPDEEWFKHHWILCENGVPKIRVIPL
jgi:hypothetical protein